MKQFTVTSIETEPDGQVLLHGPTGILRIRRHESNDPGFEHSFSHALILKSTQKPGPKSHWIEINELELGKGAAF